uniref:Methylthioadenosine phosphorylase n=1 Tax=Pseudonaja textilis TaxID=8673 RepID=A0A670ZV52_PSETE
RASPVTTAALEYGTDFPTNISKPPSVKIHINVIFSFLCRTTKRHLTFYDGTNSCLPGVCHVSMAEPFCAKTREVLLDVAKKLGIKCHSKGTVITVEGPRFSSRAESLMFRSCGADVINMTTVPEVILAKEAGICYASIAMATDYDCWKEHEETVMCVCEFFLIQ